MLHKLRYKASQTSEFRCRSLTQKGKTHEGFRFLMSFNVQFERIDEGGFFQKMLNSVVLQSNTFASDF
jgi:hypothetical protein